MGRISVIRHADARAQARWLSIRVAALLRARVRDRSRAILALPGGDTPTPFFNALSRQPAPWSHVIVTLTDERWIDPRAPGSNERQVRRALLRHDARRAQFAPLKTCAPRARAALPTLEARLRALTPIDVCVLGMGADGHVASLFPGRFSFPRKLVAAVREQGARGAAERVSLTLAALIAARHVILLIRGAEKQAALWKHLAAGAAATPIAALARARRILVSWAP